MLSDGFAYEIMSLNYKEDASKLLKIKEKYALDQRFSSYSTANETGVRITPDIKCCLKYLL